MIKYTLTTQYKKQKQKKWDYEKEYLLRKAHLRQLAELALATNDKEWFLEITARFQNLFKEKI